MKKILFAGLIISFLSSCDNRNEYFENLNKTPELKIKPSGATSFETQISDSVKLNNSLYIVDYKIVDEEKLTLNVNFTSGGGTSKQNSELNKVIIKPLYTNLNRIVFSVIDGFGKSQEAVLNLMVFENLPPVAQATIKNTQLASPREYTISAIGSYDRDSRFGGKIVQYEYKIGSNYVSTTSLNKISYIFDQPGNYQVSVRVIDDNGAWSNTFNTFIQVN